MDSNIGMTQRTLIIAATQRSGSTLFCRDMELTGVVGAPREWLQHFALEERMRVYGLKPGVSYAELVRALVARETGSNGVFSIKVMWDILDAFFMVLRRNHPELDIFDRVRTLRTFFPNPSFIYVRRADKLRQAVSYVKSLQSGSWVAHSYEAADDAHLLRFDYPAICSALAKFEEEDRLWRDFFAANGLPCFEVTYEDFVADRRATVAAALDFLGFPGAAVASVEHNDLRPMSDGVNKRWLTLFKEMHSEAPAEAKLFSSSEAGQVDVCCHLEGGEVELEAGKRFSQSVRIINTGGVLLPARGARDGQGWLQVRARWLREGDVCATIDPGRGFLAHTLAPSDECVCELTLQAPESSGIYRLVADLWQDGFGWLSKGTDLESHSGRIVDVRLGAAEELVHKLFPEAVPQLHGWKWIPWFGHVNTAKAPWLLHAELGWLLVGVEGSVGGDFWLYFEPLGWTKTAVSEFPDIWIQREDRWFRYAGRTDGVCHFDSLTDGRRLAMRPVQ